MSTKITDLRGARVTPIHRGSVSLSKQKDLCSTSFPSGSLVDGSPLVAITRRAGVFLMQSNTKTIAKRARVGPRTQMHMTMKILF